MPDSFPTFDSLQILTAAQLNTLVNAVVSRLSALTGANLSYPLVVGGNIDFNRQHTIVGLQTFWNIINVDEYATVQAAIDAAESAGGGTVFFPTGLGGDHLHVADGLTVDQGNIWLVGAGAGSTLKLTGGSTSGFLIRTAIGITGFGICNIVLDGQSTGAGQKGVVHRQVTEGQILNCRIKNFTGAAVEYAGGNAAGDECSDCTISNTKFSGGSSSHIIASDIDGLSLMNVVSKSAGADAIALVPTAANALMRSIKMVCVDVTGTTGKGIIVSGFAASASDNHGRVSLSKCEVQGQTSTAFELGTTAKWLKFLTVTGCTAHDSGAKGFVVLASGGIMSGCIAYSAATTGLDMTSSTDFTVTGCEFPDNLTAIDATSTTDCIILGTNVLGSGTTIVRTTSTRLRVHSCIGVSGPTTSTGFADFTGYALTAAATGTVGFTYTVKANTFKTGDTLKVSVFANSSGTGTIEMRINNLSYGGFNTTTDDSVVTYWIRPVTGGAASPGMMSQLRETPVANNLTTNQTIDWTIDRNITFVATANSATTTVVAIFIELIGGE